MSQFDFLRALVALDEQGSLTAAANYLRLPKSTLSRRIAKLEEILELPLTLEEKGRLTLTRAGMCYLDYARNILQVDKESRAALQQLSQEVSGEIRVRLCPDLTSGWIVTALNDFLHTYPKARLKVNSADRQADVRDKDDVILVCGQLLELEGFKCIHLGCWERRLYVGKSQESGFFCPQKVEDLADMPWIGKLDDSYPVVLQHQASGQKYSLQPKAHLRVETLSMLTETLAGGYGIGLLPAWVVECKRYGQRGKFHHCLPDWTAEPLQLSGYVRQQDRSYSVRMLISFLQQNMPQRWRINAVESRETAKSIV